MVIWHGCWRVCRWTMTVPLHMHSGFPTKMVEQMIMTSWNDVMKISHAIEGGNYKRGSATELRRVQLLLPLLSGCFSTSVRVLTKPQILYLGCLGAPRVDAYPGCTVLFVFAISMHPDLFGGLWVVMTLFIWRWPRWTTTFSPRTWYQVKHGSQPFSSKLHGWDKSLAWCESLPVYLVYLCHPTKCGPVTCATPPRDARNVTGPHLVGWHRYTR